MYPRPHGGGGHRSARDGAWPPGFLAPSSTGSKPGDGGDGGPSTAGGGSVAPHGPGFSLVAAFRPVCRALSKTPAALALNQTQHCKQLEGLVSAQVQLCRSNLELMHTVVHAAREVMKACRRAFADMRWNCSSIELAPNYLLDLERGKGPGWGRGAARACEVRAGGWVNSGRTLCVFG